MASLPFDPNNPEVRVAGLPVLLGVDGGGYYATATFQSVYVNSSPLIVYLDPPVATVAEVSLPGLLVALLGALANGAIIQA
jgi:hypothetical protein